MFLTTPASALPLIPWAVLWALGGVWLAAGALRLRDSESLLVGLIVGWLAQNWLANLLAWVLPIPAAFWSAAVIVFLVGLLLAQRAGMLRGAFRQDVIHPWQLAFFALLFLVFYSVSRGLAIFDDFAHLPTVSIMAAGDIPPHFSLDPQVIYGYHHFLLLFQAQLIRIGGLTPWAALDVGRALSFAAAVMLAALFTQRLTFSPVAGFLGGVAMALGSGTRWLMLILPRGLVVRLSQPVELIGSGAASGPNLAEALLNDWMIEGSGPVPFPFAFANGIYPAGLLTALGANGMVAFIILLLLLLTFNRWRGWPSAFLSVMIISIWGLVGEAELIAILAGWAIVAAAFLLTRHGKRRTPRSLWVWLGVVAAGCGLGFAEGGAWTDILIKTFQRVFTGIAPASYQTIGFTAAAPAVVSSHLGPLSLLDPVQVLVALFELGPVLLILPLLAAFGWKAYRLGRWVEAAFAASALFALLLVFVQFTGSTGVRNTPRLYFFMPLCAVFAVPLAWMWVSRCSNRAKIFAAILFLVWVTGGAVIAGAALPAAQRPVYSANLTVLDAQMASAYWNRLASGALVFDSAPSRATALLGRPTNSHYTWYAAKPEWQALSRTPEPQRLSAAGFRYIYFDETDWDRLGPDLQDTYTSGCPRLLNEFEDGAGASRRLYDLTGCVPAASPGN